MVSMASPPAVIAGLRNQDSLPIVALKILHYAGVALVTYTGRNSMRNFLPTGSFEPAYIP